MQPTEAVLSKKKNLISSIDYLEAADYVATSGPAFHGVKVHKLTEMVEHQYTAASAGNADQ